MVNFSITLLDQLRGAHHLWGQLFWFPRYAVLNRWINMYLQLKPLSYHHFDGTLYLPYVFALVFLIILGPETIENFPIKIMIKKGQRNSVKSALKFPNIQNFRFI